MSLPALRLVRDTDDGCSLYELLCCYYRVECRGEIVMRPASDNEAATPLWKTCPMCGSPLLQVLEANGEARHRLRSIARQRRPSTGSYRIERRDDELCAAIGHNCDQGWFVAAAADSLDHTLSTLRFFLRRGDGEEYRFRIVRVHSSAIPLPGVHSNSPHPARDLPMTIYERAPTGP